jgi:hypothetical protein
MQADLSPITTITSIVRRYDYIMISGLAPLSAAAIDLKLLRLIKHTIDKE